MPKKESDIKYLEMKHDNVNINGIIEWLLQMVKKVYCAYQI